MQISKSYIVGFTVKVVCVTKKKKKVKVNFFPVDLSMFLKEYFLVGNFWTNSMEEVMQGCTKEHWIQRL